MKNITTFAELARIKAGEEFVMRGLTYRAKDDAVAGVNEATKVAGVFIAADRANPAMPSGWEAADVKEYDSMWPAAPASTFALTGDTLLHITDRATGQAALKTLDGFLSDNAGGEQPLDVAALRRALSIPGSRYGYPYFVIWYDEDPVCAYDVCVAEFYDMATGEEG